MATILLCSSLGCSIYMAYKLYIYPNYICTIRKLPGPSGGDLLCGDIREMLQDEDPSVTHNRWSERYGPVLKFRSIFGKTRLHLVDATAIRHVMLRNTYAYARPPLMQTCFELLLGSKGLVTVTGDDHKRHRRILAPAFTQKAVDQCLPSFAATADKLCSRIKLLLNPVGPDAIKDEGFAEDHDSQKHISSNVEMSSLLNNATLDAAGLAAFGYDFKALDNGNDVTDAGAEALSGKVSLVGYFLMHALPYIPFVAYLPIKTVRHHAHALRMLQKSAEDILENTASDNGEGQTNLLSLILAANQNPSKEHVRLHDNEVVGTITNFVAAAHETTATSLSWCLVHLVQHPHIQDRLRTELAATMASHDGVVSVEAVADMPYLDAFLKESLRCSPPVRSLMRMATEDDVIPFRTAVKQVDGNLIDSISIRAGQEISISIASFNMNENVFPEPHRFDPERWLVDGAIPNAGKGTAAFDPLLTFSGGQRACIGYRFALLQEKIVLTKLIESFKFSKTADDVEFGLSEHLTTKPIIVGSSQSLVFRVRQVEA